MSSFDNNCILTPIPTSISEDGSGTPDNSLPFGSNRPKKDLDKFYTKEEIALECYSTLKDNVDIDLYDFHLEPSAGGGSFYKLLDPSKAVGIDIDPPRFPIPVPCRDNSGTINFHRFILRHRLFPQLIF